MPGEGAPWIRGRKKKQDRRGFASKVLKLNQIWQMAWKSK